MASPRCHPDPAPSRPRLVRDERGVALPSPLVLLSVVAIAMAAVAFVATRAEPPEEREVAIVARTDSPSADPSPSAQDRARRQDRSGPSPSAEPTPPPVKRQANAVEVYNNSGITGLAGQVGGSAGQAGWQVVATDNWYGSVPASTVYFPAGKRRAAEQLALDLGVERTQPAVGSMSRERLTVIITAPLG